MRFQISFKPSKYEINLYEGIRLSIKAENDRGKPLSIQKIRDVVPEGFTMLKARSSLCPSSLSVRNDTIPLEETLEPGEHCPLLTLFLVATREGNFLYHPKIVVDGQEREIGERLLSIQSKLTRTKPLVNLNINRDYEVQPDETVVFRINVESKNLEDIDYLILLDALPRSLFQEVKKEETVFPLGGGDLALLERLPASGEKNFKVRLKTKSYDELRSITELRMVEKELHPQVVAKTDQGLVKWDPKLQYTFRLDARPKLTPPLLQFKETEDDEPTFFQHQDDQKRNIYFKGGATVEASLKLKKDSAVPLHGMRITNFLPTDFEILEVLSKREFSVTPSLIKIPELMESDCSIDLKVKPPEQSGTFLVRPAINCNEIQEKITTPHPLHLHIISPENIRTPDLVSFNWSFSPAPPIYRNSSVHLKVQLKNKAILPLTDVKLHFDLPHLQGSTVETASLSVESKGGEFLIDYLKPNQKLSLAVALNCPEEASIGNWTGTLRMQWNKFGKLQKRTEEIEYRIREEKSRDLMQKLQFWRS